MFRSLLKSALVAAALSPALAALVSADQYGTPTGYVQDNSNSYGQTNNGIPADGASYGYNYAGAYPQIQASLYPCPKPDIPYEVGRTVITNPAFAPHEMLYPHTYRALYPPYYYCNKGGLSCLPFFPKPPLKGTEVTVKYKSCHGLFGYCPPCRKVCYSNRGWK